MPITASKGARKGIRDCAASRSSLRRRPDDLAGHGVVARNSHSAQVSQTVAMRMLAQQAAPPDVNAAAVIGAGGGFEV